MMDSYRQNDLRNANLLWFAFGQFVYYQFEKHRQLARTYKRVFEHLVDTKGAPNVQH